jgi:ssDNA-binding Zn-finger/Zn-ribbon topoisomerase 1
MLAQNVFVKLTFEGLLNYTYVLTCPDCGHRLRRYFPDTGGFKFLCYQCFVEIAVPPICIIKC